jgi:hypothetical protein
VSKPLAFTLVCLLGIALNCFLLWPVLPYAVHGDNDFLNLYAGSVLAGSHHLYDIDAVMRVQARIWEHPHILPFTRLPFYGVLISPLRLLGYPWVYWTWQMVCLAAVVAAIFVLPARDRRFTAVACCWSLPLMNGFLMGQDVPIVVLALAASLGLLFRGKDFVAGCVLSLCLIKFNLFLALPILVLGRRLWKFGLGAAVGTIALLAVSFLAEGWRWPVGYLSVLRLPSTTPLYPGLPNLRGLFANLPHVDYWQAAGTAVAAALAWVASRAENARLAIAAVLLCGLLVSHHAFLFDAFVVVPAAVLLWDGAANAMHRFAACLLACPLVYLPMLTPRAVPHVAIVFLACLAMLAVWAEMERRAARLRAGTE